jgi:hypothetical protein
MDFRIIFQLRDKKIWWLDVIFYFVISLLIATLFCYGIFIIKNIIQKQEIKRIEADLQTVGTQEQKEQEKEVILYKGKIGNFVELIENHEFVSNAFSFLEENTQPNVWFTQFSLDKKSAKVQLSCIAEDMDAVSRQVSTFEKNNYVKDLGSINSSLGDLGRVNFNLNLSLENTIFSYLVNLKNQKIQKEKEENITALTASLSGREVEQTEEDLVKTEELESSEKLIYSFDIPLSPEVVGKINQTDHTIFVIVPAGTDITSLTPTIIISRKATIFPESDVPQDFTQPVIYEVRAEDETIQNYIVSVKIAEQEASQNQVSERSKQSMLVKIFLIVATVAFLVVIVLTLILFIKNKQHKK